MMVPQEGPVKKAARPNDGDEAAKIARQRVEEWFRGLVIEGIAFVHEEHGPFRKTLAVPPDRVEAFQDAFDAAVRDFAPFRLSKGKWETRERGGQFCHVFEVRVVLG